MKKLEMQKIIASLTAIYPAHYSRMQPSQLGTLVDAWMLVLGEYPYETVNAGLRYFLSTETRGFPPSPGQVMDCIHKFDESRQITGMEAWALVKKAASNSNYHGQEEFTRLPKDIQRAVGTVDDLKVLGQMDLDELDTVAKSNFLRIYAGVAAQRHELNKVPARVQKLLRESSLKLLAGGGQDALSSAN